MKTFSHSSLPIDNQGFYGTYGGAFIPDVLKNNIEELTEAFYRYTPTEEFRDEFVALLKDYVGRPTPLYRADRLSQIYGARIYLKREDLNHTGAHKINNALGQVLLAKRMGKTRVIAETGAGQHGVATATACALMGMKCTIFMGKTDIERQQPNVQRMRMLGADVVAATSGNMTLKEAVDEALQAWCADPACFYLIGSAVGPHPYPEMVAYFQSVISEEMRRQLLEHEGTETPDYVIACVGGGSNASGAFYHFLDSPQVRLVAVEAAGLGIDTVMNAATMTLGRDGVLHGSRTLLNLDDQDRLIEPYSISAGLDYPGVGPMLAYLSRQGRIDVLSATDDEALDAAFELSRTEGIIPALESAHALAALPKIKFRPTDLVVVNVSGRGDKAAWAKRT